MSRSKCSSTPPFLDRTCGGASAPPKYTKEEWSKLVDWLCENHAAGECIWKLSCPADTGEICSWFWKQLQIKLGPPDQTPYLIRKLLKNYTGVEYENARPFLDGRTNPTQPD